MMVAVMSTAFTGQAIAVGFDRRYGALKRLGATPLPRWGGIIAGKSAASSSSWLCSHSCSALSVWRWDGVRHSSNLYSAQWSLPSVLSHLQRLASCSAVLCAQRSFSLSPTSCGSSWWASAVWSSPAANFRPPFTRWYALFRPALSHTHSKRPSTPRWTGSRFSYYSSGAVAGVCAARWFKFT